MRPLNGDGGGEGVFLGGICDVVLNVPNLEDPEPEG